MAKRAVLAGVLHADQQSCAAADIEAIAAKLGLWRDVDPIPPWEFRHKGGGKKVWMIEWRETGRSI